MQQSHPSVKHWDDKRGGTEMTTKGPLEDKRELLVRHVIPALDAGIQIKNQSGMKKRERTFTHLSL